MEQRAVRTAAARSAARSLIELHHSRTSISLTPAETGYLMALGVPPAIISNWLVTMNAQRNISAPHFSRYYVEQNANYSGRIGFPVLTMHTFIDPLVTV
ncbi:MAG: hypothetical protein ABIP78_03050, partial [Pyrinomonadaceae bacterium]